MGSSTGRSGVADLAFRVFARALHPDWFATRAHRRVAVDAWQADIRLVDGGHAITWRAGDVRLTEVLGPAGLPLPEAGLLLAGPVDPGHDEALEPGSGVEYQASIEAERLDPEVFAHLAAEMTLDTGRDRLFHRARGGGRLDPPAISHVAFESRPGGLLVHAFHSIPGELAVVRTQSLFETPTPRRPRR